MRDGKHHYMAVGIIIALVIISGVILNFSKPSGLTAVTNTEVETREEIIAETPTPDFESTNDNPLVGNDKDEHGCIGSAGYTWCEE